MNTVRNLENEVQLLRTEVDELKAHLKLPSPTPPKPRVARRVWITEGTDGNLFTGWYLDLVHIKYQKAIEFLEVLPSGQPDELEEATIAWLCGCVEYDYISPACQRQFDILQLRGLMTLDSEGRMVRIVKEGGV